MDDSFPSQRLQVPQGGAPQFIVGAATAIVKNATQNETVGRRRLELLRWPADPERDRGVILEKEVTMRDPI